MAALVEDITVGGFDWSALIPLGSALLGSLIGAGSAIIASRRATKTAFEQVRYARLQERQYEALARLFGYANRLHYAVYDVSRAKNRLWVLQKTIEASETFKEANNYHQDNLLWLSPETAAPVLNYMEEARGRWRVLSELAQQLPLEHLTEDPTFNRKLQETKSWLEGESLDKLVGIHEAFSETLGLTGWQEPPRTPARWEDT